jgi:hypothetical protein
VFDYIYKDKQNEALASGMERLKKAEVMSKVL